MSPTAIATDDLISDMYGELREIAARLLRHEREGHTLQKTALVHETFIRLFEKHPETALSARSFLGLAAHQMRLVLVDYGRKHRAGKRTGRLQRVPYLEVDHGFARAEDAILAIDAAMEKLQQLDQRAHAVVELKFFAGFTNQETAGILNLSAGTVEQDWQFARAWLFGVLSAKAVTLQTSGDLVNAGR